MTVKRISLFASILATCGASLRAITERELSVEKCMVTESVQWWTTSRWFKLRSWKTCRRKSMQAISDPYGSGKKNLSCNLPFRSLARWTTKSYNLWLMCNFFVCNSLTAFQEFRVLVLCFSGMLLARCWLSWTRWCKAIHTVWVKWATCTRTLAMQGFKIKKHYMCNAAKSSARLQLAVTSVPLTG